MTPELARVSAVVVAFGPEPLLSRCVDALLSETEVESEVVVVDNGCDAGTIHSVSGREGVRVVRPGRNLGFAAGANLGAGATAGEYLVFVNSDAVIRPGALRELVDALRDGTTGLVTASVRLMGSPELMNSCGNPVNFLGLSWAGGLGETARNHAVPMDVASVSGAAFACSQVTWQRLGGFYEAMFLYHEDTELSLRAWQQGLRVRYVPGAVVDHDYEFSRNPQKLALLERNRLVLMLTLWEGRTLLVLLPALVGLEVAMLIVSISQGWWRGKIGGWAWLVRNRASLRERRRQVARMKTVSDRKVVSTLTGQFVPGPQSGIAVSGAVQTASRLYWSVARRILVR